MAYAQRDFARLPPLASALAEHGIIAVEDIYSVAELAKINTAMDPIFAARTNEARAYVRPDEMLDAGILDWVLSKKMRSLVFSIVPDAVLYHLHAYEIAANNAKSHIFSDSLNGWHRDLESEFFPNDPTHVSVFVYLTDVDREDGPFEFSPHRPDTPVRPESPMVSMRGPAGMSFVWHRSFYHRAAPNRGPRRRRLIKVSVQPNHFRSQHLSNEYFKRTCSGHRVGNAEFDTLLGRYQGGIAPRFSVSGCRQPLPLRLTGSIAVLDEEPDRHS